MNLVLWIVQGFLALLCLAGGATKIFKIDDLMKQPAMAAWPRGFWRFLGLVEVVGAVLLVVPPLLGAMPEATPLAAAVLAVENLAVSAVYAKHSAKLSAANPLVWSAAMAIMALIVAGGRF